MNKKTHERLARIEEGQLHDRVAVTEAKNTMNERLNSHNNLLGAMEKAQDKFPTKLDLASTLARQEVVNKSFDDKISWLVRMVAIGIGFSIAFEIYMQYYKK